MTDWPEDHHFQVFKLEIENIFLINWFGGPKPLTVEQYLHPKVWVLEQKYYPCKAMIWHDIPHPKMIRKREREGKKLPHLLPRNYSKAITWLHLMAFIYFSFLCFADLFSVQLWFLIYRNNVGLILWMLFELLLLLWAVNVHIVCSWRNCK